MTAIILVAYVAMAFVTGTALRRNQRAAAAPMTGAAVTILVAVAVGHAIAIRAAIRRNRRDGRP